MKQRRKSIISFIGVVIIEFLLLSFLIAITYPLEEIKSCKWIGTAAACTNIIMSFYMLSKEIQRLKQKITELTKDMYLLYRHTLVIDKNLRELSKEKVNEKNNK